MIRIPGKWKNGFNAAALACGLALSPLAASHAAAWPDHTLTLIVPFGPGSSPDQMSRIVADQASKILGQTIIVQNKPGAGGDLGTAAIAHAKPDGYTFGASITGPLVNNTVLYKDLPYDPKTELAPLTLAVDQPDVLVVPSKSGIKTIQDLMKSIKDNPGKLNFATPGTGTVSQLAVELLLQKIKAKATHVPYPSSPKALTSMLTGDTQFAALPPISVMAMVNDGRLRALAVTSERRSGALPSIPTMSEVGVPGIVGSAWIGFVAPAKTPADVQKKLSDALIQAIKSPEVTKRLKAQYMDPVASTPAEFRRYMDEELARWKPLIEQLHLQVN
ncbi:tripartite tricarboxylate transporter substrate binding protein [Paralcaligenes sp. KSB-10]|uniref:Bug family tripartite tricarboxylate transporter substrate binding protein n=1 Tax=Paralcaligenes sp. KSB-10 TaxID=2901142 RepID=UPI001E5F4EB7|nr:tripartite tricarboxylate transporter substrate binding protein [Paralcaligenes sp. KSB-10]UHL63607.1 tripartite tricarboxylate transporter substrate binding protein [Paralcaligenes sp. KSB-10]